MPPKKRKSQSEDSDTEEESEMQFDSSEEAESSELSSNFTEDDESENSINVNNIIKKDTAKASKRQKVDKAAKAANREEQDEIIILEDSKEMPMKAVTGPKKKRAAILVDDDEEESMLVSDSKSTTTKASKPAAKKVKKTKKDTASALNDTTSNGKKTTAQKEKDEVTPATKNKATTSSTSAKPTAKMTNQNIPKTIKSEKDAEVVVLDYMKRANRPYSITNIFDNLHKAVPKAILQRVLDNLCKQKGNDENQNLSNTSSKANDSGFNQRLRFKDYGKSRIYFIEQEEHNQVVLEEEMDNLKKETEEYNQSNIQLKTSVKALEDEMKLLSTAMTDAELKIELERVQAANTSLETKLSTFRSSKISVDPKKKEKTQTNYKKFRKYFLERKRSCLGAIEQIADGMEKKPKDVITMMGIETDQEAGFVLPPAI